MATHYQSQNLWELKFNCLDYILLNAERQTSFNSNAMDIERKLFTSAINIAICLPHQPPKMIGVIIARVAEAMFPLPTPRNTHRLISMASLW